MMKKREDDIQIEVLNGNDSQEEDMSIYYNEGPYGPDGKPRTLIEFFQTRWKPSGGGGGSAFDDECKEYLKVIKEKVEQGICPGPVVDPDALRFRGTIDQNPATYKGSDWTIDEKPYTPQKNDIVNFGTKEFIWRIKDGGSEGWIELGDETALDWN